MEDHQQNQGHDDQQAENGRASTVSFTTQSTLLSQSTHSSDSSNLNQQVEREEKLQEEKQYSPRPPGPDPPEHHAPSHQLTYRSEASRGATTPIDTTRILPPGDQTRARSQTDEATDRLSSTRLAPDAAAALSTLGHAQPAFGGFASVRRSRRIVTTSRRSACPRCSDSRFRTPVPSYLRASSALEPMLPPQAFRARSAAKPTLLDKLRPPALGYTIRGGILTPHPAPSSDEAAPVEQPSDLRTQAAQDRVPELGRPPVPRPTFDREIHGHASRDARSRPSP